MKIKLNQSDIYRHLLIWLFIIFAVIFSFLIEGTTTSKIFYVSFFVLNLFICYYIVYLVILPSFFEKSKLYSCIFILLTALFYISWDYSLVRILLPKLGGLTERQEISNSNFIKTSIHIFSFSLVAALGSFFNKTSIERIKESTEKEKNTLKAELDFLKNQFNSHLTFNFLNLCYAKLIGKSDTASKVLENYSEMLQYSLIASTEKFVIVEKEINYIENFIEVQKCLTSKCFCEINTNIDAPNYVFASMIIPSFLENAFKHGIVDDEDNPIIIDFNIKNSILSFKLINKVDNIKSISFEGEGLNKIRQTLNILYLNKYSLETNYFDKSHSFVVNLIVKIN